jgi:capsular exopolysaccharide synthesis family protein
MFDSLRRAEAARKKLLSRQEAGQTEPAGGSAEPNRPTIEPSPKLEPLTPDLGQLAGFPKEYLRELGILKNSLESITGKGTKSTLMFVGSTRGEGTTTIVSSYAKLLSLQANQRVLLIEMNARRPSLTHKLGLTSHFGVTNYFDGEKSLDAVLQDTRQGSFKVISVGQNDPVKLQLHLDRMMPALLEAALQRFDTVLIDAPPVVGSPETPPISAHVDGVVVVVHTGKTKREVVQRSLGMINQSGGKVLGIILNRKKYYIPDFIYRRI